MISLVHLIWIVPLSVLFGIWVTALFAAGESADERYSRKGDVSRKNDPNP